MQAANRTGTKDFIVMNVKRMVRAGEAVLFGQERALGSRIEDLLRKVVRGREGRCW